MQKEDSSLKYKEDSFFFLLFQMRKLEMKIGCYRCKQVISNSSFVINL